MASVTYDDRSFMIDGRRIWLVSGSLHYFRIPADLWADRLLKAKRAGLNCVSTYIAWNFHEPKEAQWELEDNKDILEFISLADDLGLYVILRPGPYIGSEWDFGGLPAWLAGKSGISYRTNNATFMHYFDKYFAQILPQLAEYQVVNGGNIILIQNENEYQMTTMPDRTAYLDFINQLFRRSGFTIPIVNCNMVIDKDTGCSVATDPPVEDNIECINTWDAAAPSLKRQRRRQSEAPLLITEYRCGQFDHWGAEHLSRDDTEVARRALEILGCGSQFNYHMWHGGTNFAFWGSRLSRTPESFQTTSYDYDAPLSEGGGLTRKYYLSRLVNVLASSMAPYFAAAREEESGASIDDASDVMNLSGAMGQWAIATNHGREDIEKVTLCLPSGEKLSVSLEPIGAAAIPFNLKLPTGGILDYCSLTPLGLFGTEEKSVLVLHGPPGVEGVLSIDGEKQLLEVPDDDAPVILKHHGLMLVLVNSELAMRTWPLEDCLVFGPRFVGKGVEDLRHAPRDARYFILPLEDPKLHQRKAKPQATHKPAPPQLKTWKRVCICPEPISNKLQWQKLDRPKDMDKLGIHYGYAWYRIEIEEQHAHKRYLFLPNCADRASLYLNGVLIGVWGAGEGATREPIGVNFKRGRNVLVALVDNLGRFSSGDRLGELKGLYGHVYDAKALRTTKFKLAPCTTFPKRVVPRTLAHLGETLESEPIWSAEVRIPLKKVLPIQLSFTDIPHHVAVFCNDRPGGFFPKYNNTNWGNVTLGADLKTGKNVIRLLLWGDVLPKVLENVKFYTLSEPISAGAKWSYRPWALPAESVGEPIKGKGCWFITKFKRRQTDIPLFIKLYGAKKGQLYLNGHNVGRFWTIGPQEYYYLPSCWLQEENELLVFEEHGHMPSRCKLEYRPLGPYRT